MDRTIIGTFPKRQRWQVIAALLQALEFDPAAVATVAATERRLVALRRALSLT